MSKRLRPRLFVVAIACTVFGVILAYFWFISQGVPRFLVPNAELVRALMARGERDRCEQNPASWSLQVSENATLYAHDSASLKSQNPDAPAIDELLRQRYERADTVPVRLYPPTVRNIRGEPIGGVFLVTLGGDGPCAVVQTIWRLQVDNRMRLGGPPLLLLLSISALITALLIHVIITRPLIQRIERLKHQAERVGSKDRRVSLAPEAGDDELGEIALALERAHARIRQDAQELIEGRRELERHIAEITHDLRTPMTSLSLALQEMARRDAPGDDEALTWAIDELEYMSGLITNLKLAATLRDARAPDQEGAWVDVDLSELLSRLADRHRLLARRRDVSIGLSIPDEPVVCRGDAVLIEQAFANVIQNAIAYNQEGGNVAIILERRVDGWRASILDDGPGVEPEHLEHLSARTFRTDAARQRRPGGDGLGLAITAAVCDQHGWSMQIQQNEPRGLVVELSCRVVAS